MVRKTQHLLQERREGGKDLNKSLEERIKAIKSQTFYDSIEIKEVDSTTSDEYLVVKGYVNRFKDQTGNLVVDRDSDSVSPEGMSITNYMKNPVILFNHNKSEVIGKAVKVELRPDGIYKEMHIYKALNHKVYDAVRLGVLKAFSIGFAVKDLKYIPDIDCFLITDSELYESSIVAVPCNQDSIVEDVSVGGTMSLGIKGVNADIIGKSLDEVDNKEKDLLQDVAETLKQIKEMIQTPQIKEQTTETKEEQDGVQTLEEIQETDEVTKEVTEVVEETQEAGDKQEVNVNFTELASTLAVSGENFDELLEVTSILQAKLNTFLNETLN